MKSVTTSHGSATIQVFSSIQATSWIEYGTTQSLGSQTNPRQGLGDQEILVTFLDSETGYYYRAAFDVNGQTTYSTVAQFSTTTNPHSWATGSNILIQPGLEYRTALGFCTLAYIFRDATNQTLYALTAGHCFEGNGKTAAFASNNTRFGQTAYHSFCEGCPQNDIAVVRIDAAYRPYVSPKVTYWGGPTGLPLTGSLERDDGICYFGHGVVAPGIQAQNHRCGKISSFDKYDNGSETETVAFSGQIFQGDSGGPILDYATGRAIAYTISGTPATGTGLIICHALQQAGIPLRLATAPYAPPAPDNMPPPASQAVGTPFSTCA